MADFEAEVRRFMAERGMSLRGLARASASQSAVTRTQRNLTAWITETNTSDDAIQQMAQASVYLAEAHAGVAAKKVLAEVLKLHRQTHAILRGGKQRLRQTRELMRINSDLLAHACLLLGDLGQGSGSERVRGCRAALRARSWG
jgi:hypothetical protein